MDREQLDLIIRSFDADLSSKDQSRLGFLLESSNEARIEHRRLLSIREELGSLNNADFSLDFESKIMSAVSPVKQNMTRVASLDRKKWLSLAATFALLLAAGAFLWSNSVTTHAAPLGNTLAITMPEGTKVTLAPGSEMSYRKLMLSERRVELSGQAYFDVETDKTKPFIVESFNAEIEVTGTEFDVNTFKAAIGTIVYVAEGSVMVRAEGGSTSSQVLLSPGQKTIVPSLEESLEVLDIENGDKLMVWRYGGFSFDKTRMSEVLTGLSRSYDLRFVKPSPDILSRRLTYYEREPESSEQVLDAICHALSLQYKKTKNGIEFVSE